MKEDRKTNIDRQKKLQNKVQKTDKKTERDIERQTDKTGINDIQQDSHTDKHVTPLFIVKKNIRRVRNVLLKI